MNRADSDLEEIFESVEELFGYEVVKEIVGILESSVSKGNFLCNANPLRIFQSFINVKEDHQIDIPLSFEQFSEAYSEFKKNHTRYGLKAASAEFFSFLSKLKPVHVDLDITSISKKIKGKKRVRSGKYDNLGSVIAFYQEITRTPDHISLISIKNYLLEKKFGQEDTCGYIYHYYGITSDNHEKYTKWASLLNELMCSHIRLIKDWLEVGILVYFKEDPQIKKWFVDLFGEAAERYLPDWQSYQGGPPKPGFAKKFAILTAFAVNKKSPKELGYTNKTWGNFTKRDAPQGVIYLAYQLHQMVYSLIDEEKTFEMGKINQVKEIFKGVHVDQALEMLDAIKRDYERKQLSLALIPYQVEKFLSLTK